MTWNGADRPYRTTGPARQTMRRAKRIGPTSTTYRKVSSTDRSISSSGKVFMLPDALRGWFHAYCGAMIALFSGLRLMAATSETVYIFSARLSRLP